MNFYAYLFSLVCVFYIYSSVVGGVHTQDDVLDTETADTNAFQEERDATEVISQEAYQIHVEEMLSGGEEHIFETDINQLLGIIINSLYTNKDIFLRELISNASDALDKIRYQSLLDKEVLETNHDMQIYIRAFPKERRIVIRDDGHGMTKSDLILELGTIARSGTKFFIEQFSKAKEADLNLIGQFGVGFYSAFLVAERVIVVSKHNDDPVQHVWVSTADGKFTVYDDPRGNTLGRGTEIILELKEGMDKYLDNKLLQGLVEKYSEFVPYPISLWSTFVKEVDEEEYDEYKSELLDVDGGVGEGAEAEYAENEEDEEEFEEEEYEEDEDVDEEDGDDEEDEGEVVEEKGKKKIKYQQWKVVNQNQPLWTRSPKEIYIEEYQNFYKANVKHNGMWNPLSWTHFKVEGNIDFSAILYIPKKHPDRWMAQNSTDGITLYVKRVMIQDNVPGFVPRYLHFITGVVDSNDLPLHISRELLQKNKLIHVIKRKLSTKIFSLFKQLAREERAVRLKEKNDHMGGMLDRPVEEAEEEKYKYTKFWQDWGVNLRYGIIEDEDARKDLIPLLRYFSSKSEDVLTSLEDYVSRMPENQKYIYFLAGDNFENVRTSIFLEAMKKKGYEVLYFTDDIDEYMINHVKNFAGFRLVSVTDADLRFGDEDDIKKDWRKLKKHFKPLLKYVTSLLGSEVQEVRLGRRLHHSMACIVSPKYGMTANKIRIMRQRALKTGIDEMNKMLMQQRILEVNAYHPVIKKLLGRIKKNERDKVSNTMTKLMFDVALIRSGYDLGSNTGMAERVSTIMEDALSAHDYLESYEIEDVPLDDDGIEDMEEESFDKDGMDDDDEDDDGVGMEDEEVIEEGEEIDDEL